MDFKSIEYPSHILLNYLKETTPRLKEVELLEIHNLDLTEERKKIIPQILTFTISNPDILNLRFIKCQLPNLVNLKLNTTKPQGKLRSLYSLGFIYILKPHLPP